MDINILEKPINTLIENSCKGIGKLFSLALGKFLRRNEALNILNEAQARKTAKDIEEGKIVFLDDKIFPALELDVRGIPYYEHLSQKSSNLNQTLSLTAEILREVSDDEVSNDQVKEDWFTRWRDIASNFSDKDAQYLFAKILSEEIKTPGTISFRAMDILKNLTKEEAELFKKVLRFRLEDVIIFPSATKLNKNFDQWLTLSEVNILLDAGLVTSNTRLLKSFTYQEQKTLVFDANRCLIGISSNLPDYKIVLGGYILSSSGYSLANIPDSDEVDLDVLKYFYAVLNDCDKKSISKISLFKCQNIEQINIDNPDIVFNP